MGIVTATREREHDATVTVNGGVMKVALLVLAAATLPFFGSPLRAEDALAPSGPWAIDYDTDSCALRRWFGNADDPVYLEFRRFGPGLGLQTTIASRHMSDRAHRNIRYRFNDEGDWLVPGLGFSVILDDRFKGVLFEPSFVDLSELDSIEDEAERAAYLRSIDVSAIERERAAGVKTITLRRTGGEMTLQLGNFEAPIAALQGCIEELTTHWDIDADAHKTLTRRAAPVNLPDVSRMLDYPPRMVRQSMPGVVNVRLAVDEQGVVTACHIQMPLADPAFAESSCADIRHEIDFDPALDESGMPIASYWITKVVFQIGSPVSRRSP